MVFKLNINSGDCKHCIKSFRYVDFQEKFLDIGKAHYFDLAEKKITHRYNPESFLKIEEHYCRLNQNKTCSENNCPIRRI